MPVIGKTGLIPRNRTGKERPKRPASQNHKASGNGETDLPARQMQKDKKGVVCNSSFG